MLQQLEDAKTGRKKIDKSVPKLKKYTDEEGTMKNPQIIQKNPYMRSEDACRLMNNLKKIYDESIPLYKLNRIVIHKTTHYTKEEMEGITKGLAGIDNIELLQIQEFTAWRTIRFQNDNVAPFPIQRGTVIPLDKDTFLVWTHGSVQHDELAGKI